MVYTVMIQMDFFASGWHGAVRWGNGERKGREEGEGGYGFYELHVWMSHGGMEQEGRKGLMGGGGGYMGMRLWIVLAAWCIGRMYVVMEIYISLSLYRRYHLQF